MKITFLTRKEEIVLTTISLIHEVGVNNISMKEIGKREGVTEASLYKHFKNKEELLSAVLEYYEQYDQHIYSTLSNNQENATENIYRYFSIYAEYYSNYKEITSLIKTYGVLSYDKSFSQREKQMLECKTNFLIPLICKGQETNELNKEFTPEHFAYILIGTFDQIISMWRLQEYDFNLPDKVSSIVGELLTAFSPPKNSNR